MSPGSSERRSEQRCRGMTLVETLIGALIFVFVTAGVYMLHATMQNTMSRSELMSDLQQNARVGLTQMTQEIRMTAYDPRGVITLVATPPRAAIRAASSGCFSFVANVSGSGDAGQITYYLNGTTVYRKWDDWNGKDNFKDNSAQPLVGSMASLVFIYYDANGQVMKPRMWTSTQRCPPDPKAKAQPIAQLTFDQMRLVQRVAITLKAQGSRPGVFSRFYT